MEDSVFARFCFSDYRNIFTKYTLPSSFQVLLYRLNYCIAQAPLDHMSLAANCLHYFHSTILCILCKA